MRFLLLCLLSLALAGCKEELPHCGSPIFERQVSFAFVNARTGADWFAGSATSPIDSLQLLASRYGPAQRAMRVGGRALLGPVALNVAGSQSVTRYLRFNARDIDTLVTRALFVTNENDPCQYPNLLEVEITYNGRPNGFWRASVPADSIDNFLPGGGKVVYLRKRP